MPQPRGIIRLFLRSHARDLRSHDKPDWRWSCPPLPSSWLAVPVPELQRQSAIQQRLAPVVESMRKIVTSTDSQSRAPDKGSSSECLGTQLLFLNILFIFTLVSSFEIRLILEGCRSYGVIYGTEKIRNQVVSPQSKHTQQQCCHQQIGIRPNTLLHRIRGGFQLGPVKTQQDKVQPQKVLAVAPAHISTLRSRGAGVGKLIWKRQIALSKTWKSHNSQTFPEKQKPCCFMRIKSAIVSQLLVVGFGVFF